jgi:hypothetical protein
MSQLLRIRDLGAEAAFLTSIRDLDFLLLQRDWEDEAHGDLDLLLQGRQWSPFIDRVIEFSNANRYPLAKAYEIESGVICLVLLTPTGRIHLDIALSAPTKLCFGVDTERALQRRDLSDPYPLAHPDDADAYSRTKRAYKTSALQKLRKKTLNIMTILTRACEGTIFTQGRVLYVPYVMDRDILESSAVTTHNLTYLRGTLRKRYSRP